MAKKASRRKHDVFLSYDRSDGDFVEVLVRRLRGARLKVWFDREISAGEAWQEALEKGLQNSKNLVIAVGPNGIGHWQNEELRIALDERVRNPRYRVIAIMLPDAPALKTLPPLLRRLEVVDFRAGARDEEAFRKLVAGIKRKPPGPARSTRRPPTKALGAYLKSIVSSYSNLPLRGVDLGSSDPTGEQARLDLAQVYIDLDTKGQVKAKKRPSQPDEGKTRPLRALEAAAGNQSLVILGDPGSGKSTFLSHLAVCLAAHALKLKGRWIARLTDWPKAANNAIPIPVVLRDFARWVPKEQGKAGARHLWEFILERLKDQNHGSAKDVLEQALESGEALVLLDGLDEIASNRQREFVRDAVAAFAERYSASRFIVTCRTLSYQDPAWQLAGVRAVELAPFSEEKIQGFIKAWYAELGRIGVVKEGDAAGLAARLAEAVQRPDLWRLAPNPLLLTVMALVHTHKGRLPEARALLYEDTIDILLWRWEQIKLGPHADAPIVRQLLLDAGRTDVDLKRTVWQLAFAAHRKGGAADKDSLADIGELELQNALAELHPDGSRDWARELIEAMKLRAGLLLERVPQVYTFPHRTFQEYLAGAYLSSEGDFARQAAELVAEGAFWREAVLLAVGRLVYLNGETARPLALVGELCPPKAKDTNAAWQQAWFAGDVLLEIGLNRASASEFGQGLVAQVRERIAELVSKGRLTPVERVAVANTLARLGDPRFRADVWHLPDDPRLGFVEVPAGKFIMGSDGQKDADALDRELPQHELALGAYYIGRYPVTVAQFRAFREDTKQKPGDPDCLRGLPNHPVARVSWHEALAYCEWLTRRLPELADGMLAEAEPKHRAFWQQARDGRLEARLPSEAAWEKAARGTDGRIYPWGRKPDPDAANYGETGINATSAVGCFPAGVSPYGCLDMSGNVFEWTRSLWGKSWEQPQSNCPYDPADGREALDAADDVMRVLRGGCFFGYARSVRCAFRDLRDPHYRFDLVGFRVLLSPL